MDLNDAGGRRCLEEKIQGSRPSIGTIELVWSMRLSNYSPIIQILSVNKQLTRSYKDGILLITAGGGAVAG